jgi:very-short-patch-repair endonuclease
MRAKSTTAVREAAQIAGRQHGVIAMAQLLGAGFSAAGVNRWVQKGLLHREFRGVYRFGHRAPSWEARYMAAVLACGPGAVLSGRAAGFLLGAIKGKPPPPEVSAPVKRRVKGVRVRRCRLERTEKTRWLGVPVTSIARTLADLAAILPLDDLARACHEAEVKHHVRAAAVLEVAGTAPGVAKLRAILEGDAPALLSWMEREMRRLLKRHGLPLPQTNRPQGAHYVDCRWPEHRLTVELDSYRYHHSRHAWETDRRRDRAARARGDTYRRYTYRDIAEDPLPMLRELAALVAFPALLA